VARWVDGEPATHAACNRLLASFPGLRDLHPGNVVVRRRGVVVDFGVREGGTMACAVTHAALPMQRQAGRLHRASEW